MAVTHRVDVVVVSCNSRDTLRDCLRGVVGHPEINVIVVDNASADGSLEVARELGVTAVAAPGNVGFRIGVQHRLASRGGAVRALPEPGCVHLGGRRPGARRRPRRRPGPRRRQPAILNADGSLDYSQRRFPRLRSTFAVALMLHRLLPRASWTDEIIRTPESYDRPRRRRVDLGSVPVVRRSQENRRLRRGFLPLSRGHGYLQANVG
jgi:glycosyltransferase involved in cell wall biosynthesis